MKVTHKHSGGYGLVLSKPEAEKLAQLVRAGRFELEHNSKKYNADFAVVLSHILPSINSVVNVAGERKNLAYRFH